tara:strand:+ start:491 stop:634 length:144 start_codon:yes stop_codon:yes gene_type:complete
MVGQMVEMGQMQVVIMQEMEDFPLEVVVVHLIDHLIHPLVLVVQASL